MGGVAPHGLVLAVDGGNSKTDVALLTARGELLSWVRGPGSALAPPRAAAVVARLGSATARHAGLTTADLARAHAACYLAGADLPEQVAALRAALAEALPGSSVTVGNDAWAPLRVGAAGDAPAVGVVCGAGLKCVARHGDRLFEFPGLGWQSGDLSGAGDFLAREAVRVAARAEDGRGPATALREAVCERLGTPTVRAVAERLAAGTLSEDALRVLGPAVLELAAAGDPVAASIVDVLAHEVAALARTARRRFPVTGSPWALVLGGGLFADPACRLLTVIRSTDPDLARDFDVTVIHSPPVAGAALLGLDHVLAPAPGSGSGSGKAGSGAAGSEEARSGATGSGEAALREAVCRAFRDSAPQLIAAWG
jgi:N-acetylglucosamine kinase-like BadF-type ATPase